jgi:transcriptional regulator with XRE-family HTH domain
LVNKISLELISNRAENNSMKKLTTEYSIGERCRYLRTKRDKSQIEIAKHCEITAAYLSQIENDQRTPTVDILRRLAEALEVSPAVFFVSPEVHVFDMKKLRAKYKKKADLNDTVFRGITEVLEYARKLGF